MVRPGVTQEAAGEVLAAGAAHGVDRLPGDEHRHHGGLARAGGELQREAHQFGVGVLVGAGEVIEQALARLGLGRDLGQPDGGFDRLDLAEERADAAELVMPPVLKQAGRFRRDLPLAGVGQGAPRIHMAAHLVDDRGGIVLLLLGGEALAFVEDNLLLARELFRFFGLGMGVMNSARRRCLDDLLRGLPCLIQLPVPQRTFVGGVQDRVVEERVGHDQPHAIDDRPRHSCHLATRRGILGKGNAGRMSSRPVQSER